VVDEELTREEEERKVVNCPDDEEEACVVPEAVSDGWKRVLGHSTEDPGGGDSRSGMGSIARRLASKSAAIIPTYTDKPTTQVHQPIMLPIR